MSTSSTKLFKKAALNQTMISEFQAWIKNSITWRMKAMGYVGENDHLSPALNDAINDVLYRHTNLDYLTVADTLTSDLETTLVYHGVNINDAIRLSWKWSD